MRIHGYEWPLRASLTLSTIALVAALIGYRARARKQESWVDSACDLAAANLLFAFLVAFSYMWARREGLPFILTGRESFLTYLAAYNAVDFHTVVVQDIAIGDDASGHPFYYLNHPNLPSRLASFFWQKAGLNLQAQLLAAMCVSTVGLTLAYRAFRAFISPLFSVAFLAFLVASYSAYFPKSYDLLWSINNAIFWVVPYLLLRDPTLERRRSKQVFFVTMLSLGLADWGLCTFAIAFSTLWLTLHSTAAPWKRLSALIAAPVVLAMVFYALMIVDAVGLQAFLQNLSINLQSRLGQSAPLRIDGTQADELAAAIAWLRGHNIAILPRPNVIVTFAAFLQSYYAAMSSLTGNLRLLFVFLTLGCVCYLLWRVFTRRPSTWVAALIFGLVLFNVAPPAFLLLAAGLILTSPIGREFARTSLSSNSADLDAPMEPEQFPNALRGLQKIATFVSVVFLSLLAAYALLPSYSVNNTLNLAGINLPGGVIEASLFAALLWLLALGVLGNARLVADHLRIPARSYPANRPGQVRTASLGLMWVGAVAFLLTTAVPFENLQLQRLALLVATGSTLGIFGVIYPREASSLIAQFRHIGGVRAFSLATCAVFSLVLAFVYLRFQFDTYVSNRPQQYAFAELLSEARFQGRGFVTNNDDAAVWYFTKGWAYSISSALPTPGVRGVQMYFADSHSSRKYEVPDFYVCDNTRFAPAVNLPLRPDGTRFEDCSEAATFLHDEYGYKTIQSTSDYAVVALR